MTAHEALVGLGDDELLGLAPAATHQHYKGGLYRLVGAARDADTGDFLLGRDAQPRVLYQHLHPHSPDFWVRDRCEFFGPVQTGTDKATGRALRVQRFRPLNKA